MSLANGTSFPGTSVQVAAIYDRKQKRDVCKLVRLYNHYAHMHHRFKNNNSFIHFLLDIKIFVMINFLFVKNSKYIDMIQYKNDFSKSVQRLQPHHVISSRETVHVMFNVILLCVIIYLCNQVWFLLQRGNTVFLFGEMQGT